MAERATREKEQERERIQRQELVKTLMLSDKDRRIREGEEKELMRDAEREGGRVLFKRQRNKLHAMTMAQLAKRMAVHASKLAQGYAVKAEKSFLKVQAVVRAIELEEAGRLKEKQREQGNMELELRKLRDQEKARRQHAAMEEQAAKETEEEIQRNQIWHQRRVGKLQLQRAEVGHTYFAACRLPLLKGMIYV